MDELRNIALIHKPQIIAVTESWGKPYMEDNIFELDKYSMYRTDKIGGGSGGTLLWWMGVFRGFLLRNFLMGDGGF